MPTPTEQPILFTPYPYTTVGPSDMESTTTSNHTTVKYHDMNSRTHPLQLHAAIYWSVFVGVIVLTLGSLLMFYRCVARHYSDVHYRLTYYDYETLRNTKFSLASNVLLYRHRPLLLEGFKILWLLSISLCMVLRFSKMAMTFSLIMWCTLDIFMLIDALIKAMFENNIIRRRSHHATRLAKLSTAIYSFLFGIPVGTVTKLIVIFWLHGRVGFSLAFTLAGCCIGATGLALLLASMVLLIKGCCRAAETAKPSKRTVYLLLLAGVICLVWAYLYSCLGQCSEYSDMPDYMEELGCRFWAQYWGSLLLPVTLPMLIATCAITTKMTTSGMIWRFFPEMMSAWYVTVAAHVSAFQMDIDTEAYYKYFVLQIVACQFVCLIILISYNAYTIMQTVAVWNAVCSRQTDQMADLLHLTQTERNLYFGGAPEEGPVRKLNTLKKSVLKRLYEKMDKYNTIRAFLQNTLRENIKKYGDVSQCAICFEDYTENPEKVVLGVSKVCGHYFHFDCVWKWLERKATCPLCRDPVTLEKGDLKAITYEHVQQATTSGSQKSTEDKCQTEKENNEPTTSKDVEEGTDDSNGNTRDHHRNSVDNGSSTASEGVTPPVTTADVQIEHHRPAPTAGLPRDGQRPPGARGSQGLPRVHTRRPRQRSAMHQRSFSQPGQGSPASSTMANFSGSQGPPTSRRRHGLFAAFTTCTLCRQRFAGNPSDIIVGFLTECGHFFHYACIQAQLQRDNKCSQCVKKLSGRSRNDGPASVEEQEHYNRTVTMDNVRFAFLGDVIANRRRPRP